MDYKPWAAAISVPANIASVPRMSSRRGKRASYELGKDKLVTEQQAASLLAVVNRRWNPVLILD